MELFDHPRALLGAQPPKHLAFGWFCWANKGDIAQL